MSTLATMIKNSRVQTLLVILALGCVIWFAGPHLSFSDHHPLATAMNRVICLLALALLWGLSNIVPDFKESEISNISYQISNEIRMLHNNFKDILRRVQKSPLSRLFRRQQINWYMIIGPQDSGKSTLLNTAINELKLSENMTSAITNTHLCDYWLFPNTIFMALTGSLFEENETDKHHQAILQEFTMMLKRHHINLSGIVITLPLQEMLGNNEQQTQCYNNIRQFLQRVQLEYATSPIEIILTKCDRIAGFNEFFDDMDEQTRRQSCGVEFGLPPYSKPITDLFQENFDAFIAQLNSQIIHRVHTEHQPSARQLIKDFPTQLEILKPILGRILNEILPNTNISLSGIYLTSSTTQDSPINNLIPAIQTAFRLPSSSQLPLEPMQQKSYFIEQVFEKLTSVTPPSSSLLSKMQFARVTIIAIACTSISAGLFYHYFQGNLKNFLEARNALSNTQNSAYSNMLSKLTALETTMVALNTNQGKKLANEDKLIQQAYRGYWDMLQQQFLPDVVEQVGIEIKSLASRSTNPGDIKLLRALKTYLMLTDSQHLNISEVEDWLATYWNETIQNEQQSKQMQRFLSIALRGEIPAIPANTALVQQARTILEKSPADMIMNMIENDINAAPISLIKNRTNLVLDPEYNSAPARFTQILFFDIYHHQIPHDAKIIANSHWVFGTNNHHQLTDELTEDALINQVRTLYLEQYVGFWQQFIGHIHYTPSPDLNQYSQQLKAFVSDESPLQQLLAVVKSNTSEIQNETEFNQVVAKHFENMNQLNFTKDEQLFESLSKLNTDMQQVLSNKDPLVAAFQMAKERMDNPNHADAINLLYSNAKNAPTALRPFFNQMASNGWQLILSDAQRYLNIVWQNFIFPEYETNINNRYPVFSDATQDISLPQFARFFAPNGVIQTYLNNYVDSFIDKHDYNWKWKSVNGQSLQFSQTNLELFMRSTLIEKMFFGTEPNQPNIRFTLTGMSMHPNIKSFSMILDGQEIAYQQEHTQIYPLSWPGPRPDGATLTFSTGTGNNNTVTYNGTWGIFRLLDHSKINTGHGKEAMKVKIQYDTTPLAEYQLTTESVINPFTPNLLNRFRCPKTLT